MMSWDEYPPPEQRPWEDRVRRARERHNEEHARKGITAICLYCCLRLGELPPWPAPLQEGP